MIIALAGRRIDRPDAETTRFPPHMAGVVQDRLRDLLVEREATAVVCSGACGADLLALEAAGMLGLRRRMVLPFEPARFRDTSVADRPGAWSADFDRVVEKLAASGDLVVLTDAGEHSGAFAATNEAILNEAQALGNRDGSGVLAVIVWEGSSRGDGDVTEAFAESARARGIEVAEIRTR